LKGFLAQHPGLRAFVEAKPEAVQQVGAGRLLEAILKGLGDVARRCVLISFSMPFLELARRECRLPLGLVLTHWRQTGSSRVKALGPKYLFSSTRQVPRFRSLSLPRLRHPKLCVYEVRKPKVALKLFKRGTAMIETMSIEQMMKGIHENI
jgi:hypothetical protein